MTQVYLNALDQIDTKMEDVCTLMRHAKNEASRFYFETQLDYLFNLKRKVLKRSKVNQNVIFIDFVNKTRVA